MVKALLFDPEGNACDHLEKSLTQHCPNVSLYGKVSRIENIQAILDKTQSDFLFVEVNRSKLSTKSLCSLAVKPFEFIVVSESAELAHEAYKCNAAGFILKPIDARELQRTIQAVCIRKENRKEKERHKQVIHTINRRLAADRLVGIPTMEGFDFVKIGDILRCEGLQRCTQVVTIRGRNLISSYNLGEFCRLLEPFDFFSPHRSHLINLNYIKEYKREGTIIMQDGSSVPTARRRKAEFLSRILHL